MDLVHPWVEVVEVVEVVMDICQESEENHPLLNRDFGFC